MRTFREQIRLEISYNAIMTRSDKELAMMIDADLRSRHPQNELIEARNIAVFDTHLGPRTGFAYDCLFSKDKDIWKTRRAYRQRNRKLWRKT